MAWGRLAKHMALVARLRQSAGMCYMNAEGWHQMLCGAALVCGSQGQQIVHVAQQSLQAGQSYSHTRQL